MHNRTKTTLFLVLTVATLCLAASHYLYIASLTPITRDLYQSRDTYQRTGEWSLDATPVADKYFSVGMSEEEANILFEQERCTPNKNSYRSPIEAKKYEKNIACFKRVKADFFGIRLPFFNTYKIVIARFKRGQGRARKIGNKYRNNLRLWIGNDRNHRGTLQRSRRPFA